MAGDHIRGEERTIMLVGETGSGKSTLIDGIVNYVIGVGFADPFRFTLVKQEDEGGTVHTQVFCFFQFFNPEQNGMAAKY